MPVIVQALLIFLARISDVSIGTLRTILLVKGNRKIAAFLGFFEVLIYLIVLSNVVGNLNKPILIVAYCLGYASGNLVGGKIEERLSLGRVSAVIMLKGSYEEIVKVLRNEGFGVTIFKGMGLDGESYMLNVILERRQIQKLNKVVYKLNPHAFITITDVRSSAGGHFVPKKK
ncbi:MAG: DUF2179 domain-containing protein [Clostridiales bacterium]|nr:DUF2179 domain-containing protein [Clostridiales bacterium]